MPRYVTDALGLTVAVFGVTAVPAVGVIVALKSIVSRRLYVIPFDATYFGISHQLISLDVGATFSSGSGYESMV